MGSWKMRGATGLSTVAFAVAGWFVVDDTSDNNPLLQPREVVQSAIDSFEDGDHIHVDATARGRIKPEVVDEANQKMSASELPTYILVADTEGELGFSADFLAVLQMHEQLGPGLFIIWGPNGDGYDRDLGIADPYLNIQYKGEPNQRLLALADQVSQAPVELEPEKETTWVVRVGVGLAMGLAGLAGVTFLGFMVRLVRNRGNA